MFRDYRQRIADLLHTLEPAEDRSQLEVLAGGQEMGLRSGTLAVHQTVGFGAAANLASDELRDGGVEAIRILRDRLWSRLRDNIEYVALNGAWAERLPNNLNITFRSVDGDELMANIRNDVAVSFGSACKSKSVEPSHVLLAMGLTPDLARRTIRFGLGRFNTVAEVDLAAEMIATGIKRAMRPKIASGKAGQSGRDSGDRIAD